MFKDKNFCHIASNNRNEKKAGIFVYKTTDDLATVTTNGYFNEKIIDINLHDLIIHEWHNPADRTKVQKNVLCVTERTLDNVGTTVVKSKWEADTDQIVATLQEQVGQIVGNYVTLTTEQTITGKKRFEREIETTSVITIEQYGSLRFYANNTQYVTLRFSLPYIEIGNKLTPIKILGNNARPLYNNNSTLALLSDVDLAANSGRMITDQGLWYAKMDSATVAPSAENGTNYADFSQVDGQGNPIIVTYTRTNGAWVQDQTITPPAEYDGYVPITSKIWDIPEQSGQQGGRILWNHQSKEFTPYPQIVSFENAALTGNSTVVMPGSPTNNSIVNKDYVDNAVASAPTGYNIGDIFFTLRGDQNLNGAVECDGSPYQTTDFTGAQTIGSLLEAGKIPYVSLADYEFLLQNDGSVGKFGWDGTGTTTFRVPKLNTNIFVQSRNPQNADLGGIYQPGLPNITGEAQVVRGSQSDVANGAFYISQNTAKSARNTDASMFPLLGFDASRSSSVYKNNVSTVQPYAVRLRLMVQLV